MFEKTNGSRAEVWHGTAKKTPGGLTKSDLLMNKHGRIVSRKKHNTAKREKRLVKAGYLTKKGHFGFIKKGSKKMRGGTGAPTGPGMQGTPAGNAMAGKAMPMNKDMMGKGMMKGGYGMMMHKGMMGGKKYSRKYMKGGYDMMMDKDMMMKGGNAMMMDKGMMPKGMMGMMKKGGSGMMMPKGMMGMMKKGGRGTMKMMKGGMYALSPSAYDGQGVGTSGAALQLMATNMN